MISSNSGASIECMNNVLSIRQRFGMSQDAFGGLIGVTQGNVSHYENGRQDPPPDVAKRIIEEGAKLGIRLTYDDVYGPVEINSHRSSPSALQATGIA